MMTRIEGSRRDIFEGNDRGQRRKDNGDSAMMSVGKDTHRPAPLTLVPEKMRGRKKGCEQGK